MTEGEREIRRATLFFFLVEKNLYQPDEVFTVA